MLKLSLALILMFFLSLSSFAEVPPPPAPGAPGPFAPAAADTVTEEWTRTTTGRFLTDRQVQLNRELNLAIDRNDSWESIMAKLKTDNTYEIKRFEIVEVRGGAFGFVEVRVFKDLNVLIERKGVQTDAVHVTKTRKANGDLQVTVEDPPLLRAIRVAVQEQKYNGLLALVSQPDAQLSWDVPLVTDIFTKEVFEGKVPPKTERKVALNEAIYAAEGAKRSALGNTDLKSVISILIEYPSDLRERDARGNSFRNAYTALIDGFTNNGRNDLTAAEQREHDAIQEMITNSHRAASDVERSEFRRAKAKGDEPPSEVRPH